jgi:hypothetical protein
LPQTAGPVSEAMRVAAAARAELWWGRLNARQREILNDPTRELMVAGDNRIGKSLISQLQLAWWATGIYPAEYRGLRADGPVPLLCLGETQATTRDTFGEPVFGTVEREKKRVFATGFDRHGEPSLIAPEWVHFGSHALKTTGLIQLVFVRHVDGKCSTIQFGSYTERTRTRKGYSYWAVLIDEGAGGLSGYMEAIGRLVKTQGPARVAWCPVITSDGENELYDYFDRSADQGRRKIARYRIDQATHLGADAIRNRIADLAGTAEEMPRLWGVKAVVGGKSFPRLDGVLVPPNSERVGADRLIIGTDLPHTTGCFAAVKVQWDDRADIVWVVAEYQGEGLPRHEYSSAALAIGGGMTPVAWPHDGMRSSGTGKAGDSLVDGYRRDGLNMLFRSAGYENEDGSPSRSIRRGIADIRERILTKRIRFCREWTPKLVQQVDAHRLGPDGKPTKGVEDHLVDALIKALMDLRFSERPSAQLAAVRPPKDSFSYYDRSKKKPQGLPMLNAEFGTFDDAEVGGGLLIRTGWNGRRL